MPSERSRQLCSTLLPTSLASLFKPCMRLELKGRAVRGSLPTIKSVSFSKILPRMFLSPRDSATPAIFGQNYGTMQNGTIKTCRWKEISHRGDRKIHENTAAIMLVCFRVRVVPCLHVVNYRLFCSGDKSPAKSSDWHVHS